MYVDLGVERSKVGMRNPLNVTTVIGHISDRLGGATRGADFGGVPLCYGGGDLWQKKSPRRRQMGYHQ
jgi:hypothetical protein